MAQEMKKSTRTIDRWVKKLRDEGKIEFTDGKKTGGYYSVGKDHNEPKDKTP